MTGSVPNHTHWAMGDLVREKVELRVSWVEIGGGFPPLSYSRPSHPSTPTPPSLGSGTGIISSSVLNPTHPAYSPAVLFCRHCLLVFLLDPCYLSATPWGELFALSRGDMDQPPVCIVLLNAQGVMCLDAG